MKIQFLLAACALTALSSVEVKATQPCDVDIKISAKSMSYPLSKECESCFLKSGTVCSCLSQGTREWRAMSCHH